MQDSTRQNGFETVFQNSKDGLAIFKQGAFVDCNPPMLQMVGLTRKEELIGKTPFDFSPPQQPDGRDSEEKGLEYINHCLDQGSVRFEWVHQTIDAQPFWAEVLITTTLLNGKKVRYFSTRDISEKKELEIKLSQQKESFETLFNESVDGLCWLEGDRYIDCNKAFLTLFGFQSKEEVVGLTPMDISAEFQEQGVPSKILVPERLGATDSQESVRFEWKHKKVDGTEFWAEIILSRIMLNGKKVRYAITRDISEKKELAMKLQERNHDLNASNTELENMLVSLKEAQDKLIESEKMASLGSLVAGVAHEINTPVGVGLMGITQFKEDIDAITKRYNNRELTPTDFEAFLTDANEICELVKTNLDRTAQLVKGFKQIAVDQTSEEDREVNLSHYVSEVIASLNSVLKKSQAAVTLTCPDNIVVVLNPGLLYQVLSNLIMISMNHGFKDTPAGQILIVIEDSGNTQFSLNYRDNGSGISAEHLPQIFNPFFTTNRANGGTGLGLNVTYNIITSALGGSIECRSDIGEGVEFLLTFKVKQRRASAAG